MNRRIIMLLGVFGTVGATVGWFLAPPTVVGAVGAKCWSDVRCANEGLGIAHSLQNLSYAGWGNCSADSDCISVPVDVRCLKSRVAVPVRRGAEMNLRKTAVRIEESDCNQYEQSGCERQMSVDVSNSSVACVSGICQIR